jgi:hypothetical protein
MERDQILLSPQNMYDATGTQKWREFIDGKDQVAAEKEFQEKLLGHPGEYYNWQREEKKRVFVGMHWEAFQEANNYVSESIGKNTQLSAKEYYVIHMLAANGYESAFKKGWREDEVTWGLRDVTAEKIKNLEEKKLKVVEDRGPQGATVIVAAQKQMPNIVQELIEEYFQELKKSPFIAAVHLYVRLEALHPTKDASSRTNHLVLNKLLVEQGKPQAIIYEPNTPELNEDEACTMIHQASERGRAIILELGLTADQIQAARKARKEEDAKQKKIDEMMKKMGMGSKK